MRMAEGECVMSQVTSCQQKVNGFSQDPKVPHGLLLLVPATAAIEIGSSLGGSKEPFPPSE